MKVVRKIVHLYRGSFIAFQRGGIPGRIESAVITIKKEGYKNETLFSKQSKAGYLG